LNPGLLEYYGRRAGDYENVYKKPERQFELDVLSHLLRQLLAGEDALEIACGTGYWTAVLAPVVRSIVATDASPETLALARQKPYPAGKVRIELADAYEPATIAGHFTAAVAGFWWSHVPRQELSQFLRSLHRRLDPGARVVFCDNRYVEGSSTPVARKDAAGNTYQLRHLGHGEKYEVLKNFPDATELNKVLRGHGGTDISITELEYFWCAAYRTARSPFHEQEPMPCDRSP
jgi:SAM-dependent methyltransferase